MICLTLQLESYFANVSVNVNFASVIIVPRYIYINKVSSKTVSIQVIKKIITKRNQFRMLNSKFFQYKTTVISFLHWKEISLF